MPDPTELIDDLIAKTPDWRGATVPKCQRSNRLDLRGDAWFRRLPAIAYAEAQPHWVFGSKQRFFRLRQLAGIPRHPVQKSRFAGPFFLAGET